MIVRDAGPGAVAALTEIYNDVLRHTTAIWSEVPVDEADRAAWVEERQVAGVPVLVAVEGAGEDTGGDTRGAVLGYASYGSWRSREGYRHTVEHSVHVRRDQRGRGVGRALMESLLDRARAAGVHVVVGAVESGNAASIRLHEGLGFTHAGTLPEVGTKSGRWLDLTLLQLRLDDRTHPGE